MSSYHSQAVFFDGWQNDIAKLIAVETGAKQLSKSQIDLVNKKYEEAIGYKYTGNTIDPYVSKNAKVSLAVAKAFRMEIPRIKELEIERQKKEHEKKTKFHFEWYHWALIGGGMIMFISLSPSINTAIKSLTVMRK